jgi:hypothetical protein
MGATAPAGVALNFSGRSGMYGSLADCRRASVRGKRGRSSAHLDRLSQRGRLLRIDQGCSFARDVLPRYEASGGQR